MADFASEDVARTIGRVCTELQPSAAARGIDLTAEGSCPPFPHHRTRLYNAIYNTVINALPHVAPGGSIRIILSQVDSFAEIAIVDTGNGLPKEVKADLFEDKVIATTLEGAGLGTRIIESVARAHGGTVLVESMPGKGTTFRLRFPLHRAGHGSADLDAVLAAVHRVATRLLSRPTLDDLLPEVVRAALESVGAQAGTIWLHDPKDDTLVFRHGLGGKSDTLTGVRIPSNKGIAGAVFHSGQSVITGDAGRDPRHLEIAKDFRTEPLITLPLRNMDGRSIGVLQVLNTADHTGFSPDRDMVILETLASLAAAAIENARRAEQERKAAVADAIGDIAHDIKNMMTPVEAWMLMLDRMGSECRTALERLEKAVPPAHRGDLALADECFGMLPEAIRSVQSRSQEVQDRGAEIADALKGNVRQPVFVHERVDRTIGRVCHTVKPMAEARSVTVTLEGHCPPFPHDRTHIFHAVYNLVTNAIPHVSAGGCVQVILGHSDDCAEITVVDNGKGMPEETRANLFTSEAVSHTAGGTGLGTQIVAKVVALHNGTVSVESSPGNGATIRIRLPLRH